MVIIGGGASSSSVCFRSGYDARYLYPPIIMTALPT